MIDSSQSHSPVRPAGDHANVSVFPPVLPLGALAVGLILQFVHPLGSLAGLAPMPLRLALAGLCAVPGAALLFGCGRALLKAQTNVNPRLPTTTLVQDWPFTITRNPMYLGGNLVYLGLGLAVPLPWVLVLFPIPAVLCHFLVVRREEEYLLRKFGDEYRTYCRRVRRWL